MDETFLVRDFSSASDADGVRRCFVALQDHEHGIHADAPAGEAIANEYLAWMFERVQRYAGWVMVAVLQGNVVGFVTVLARVPRSDPDDPAREHALLSELSVLPECRGHGIGRALIRAAEEFAVAAGAVTARVTVVAGNAGAQRLYARAGFEDIQRVMEKRLPSPQ